MKIKVKLIAATIALATALLFNTGCDSDDGGGVSGDIGNNNPNLVACVGDSITAGYACDGSPYPSKLAGMISKNVSNYGVGGTTSNGGIALVNSALASKPAYVCIMFGSNDAIRGYDTSSTAENIRTMIRACKNNNSIPIVANIPIMIGPHERFNAAGERISEAIRQVAKEEGVCFVDVRGAFGSGEEYINSDGLHLTDKGGTKLAQCFASKF